MIADTKKNQLTVSHVIYSSKICHTGNSSSDTYDTAPPQSTKK